MTHTLRLVLFFATLLLCSQAISGDKAGGFTSDLLWQIGQVEKEVMSLEDAVPQEKFTWRPSEGVRSISEAYLHMAFGNYLLLKLAGFEPPAEAGWSMDMKKWEAGSTDKKAIAATLRMSFDHLRNVVGKVEASDLDREFDFFGDKITVRNGLMSAVGHLHEHLGQSIAYARMNGVVPPWTAAEQMKEKAEKEKKN